MLFFIKIYKVDSTGIWKWILYNDNPIMINFWIFDKYSPTLIDVTFFRSQKSLTYASLELLKYAPKDRIIR